MRQRDKKTKAPKTESKGFRTILGLRGHRIEWALTALFVVILVFLHAYFANKAGALWRDEVNSIRIALLPSWGDILSALKFDSFPLLSTLVFRFWAIGGLVDSDAWFRLLGLIIGLSITAGIWLSARWMGGAIPLVAMALFGFNQMAIRFGDSLRPYGLGVLMAVLAFGAIWRVSQDPTRKNILLAGLFAILSVQSIFQNVFLLSAACLAACVVCLRKKAWKRILIVAAIGAAAAISLLPYIPSIKAAQASVVVAQYKFGFSSIWEVFVRALGSENETMFRFWAYLSGMCVILTVVVWGARTVVQQTERNRDLALFSLIAMVVSTGGLLFFFSTTDLPTQPWYYIPLMAIVAISIDTIISLLVSKRIAIFGRLVLAAIIVVIALPSAATQLAIRQTNIDLIASDLEQRATKDDLIVVNPYFCGVSFNRYYQGAAPWTTIPPLEEVRVHRYDLLKVKMTEERPIQPVLERISHALQSGNRIWLVGSLSFPEAGQGPPDLPPAPNGPGGWYSAFYLNVWTMQLGYFINSHVTTGERVDLRVDQPIMSYEGMSYTVFKGWRP